MKKRVLIIILIVLIILLFGLNVTVWNKKMADKVRVEKKVEDGLIYNNNATFTKEYKEDGLVFQNISAFYDGSSSTLSYSIVNESNQSIHMGNFILIIKDKNEVELTRIEYNYDYDIKPNQDYPTSHIIHEDISNAYSIEYIVNS